MALYCIVAIISLPRGRNYDDFHQSMSYSAAWGLILCKPLKNQTCKILLLNSFITEETEGKFAMSPERAVLMSSLFSKS